MTEESKKWKSRLLSSSLPLEYQIATILAELGFSVSHDYSYTRKDGNEKKEFSTDIHAMFFADSEETFDYKIDVLAECKYREEGKKWLFLPEVNSADFSNQTLGYTITGCDSFSKVKYLKDEIYEFEQQIDFSLKGVEVNISSGEVFDKDIRHGINQLKYALPYLLKNNIEFNIFGHIDDCVPWFIIPILITNAELHILHDHFSVETVKSANSIDEISYKVPYLIHYSDVGPDFIKHHKSVFKGFGEYVRESEILNILEDAQSKLKGKYNLYNSPIKECLELEFSQLYKLKQNNTHFLICNSDSFSKLLIDILEMIDSLKKTE